jgi:hypothetical protein
MSITQKIKNWWGAEQRASIFSLSNIKGVVQSYLRRKNSDTPTHIKEQAKWRLDARDPVCKKQGYCRLCGCGEEKVWEDRSCDGACYPNIMSNEDWQVFKKFLKKRGLML